MIGVVVPLLLGISGLMYYIYEKTLTEIEEIFDAELVQTAGMIADLSLWGLDNGSNQNTVRIYRHTLAHKYEKHIGFQVWKGDVLVLHSQDAPATPMADRPGYSTPVIDGKKWQVFGLYPVGTPFRIYTGEDNKARNELAEKILRPSLNLLLILLPLLLLIIYFLVKKGLSPLEQLSQQVRQQKATHLVPIRNTKVPEEVTPLVDALNGLLLRLDDAMENERRFTANASHELRTPLSSIRLHSQLALNAPSEEERQKSLQQIVQAVDQSTHLIKQLLVLGRLPAEVHNGDQRVCKVAELCKETLEQLQSLAAEKKVDIQPRGNSAIEVKSNPHLLSIMLRNLLDNAVRYSPEGSVVQCRVEKSGNSAVITVEDEGPGIPESQLSEVRRRFVRLAGQEVEGCGLGLSIVSLAAEQLGIGFELANRQDGTSGLIARLTIPLE